MLLREYAIEDQDHRIMLDLRIPNKDSKIGIVLLHGAYVNRKSLSRRNSSFAGFIAQELKATILAPDFFGETKNKNKNFSTFDNMRNIVSNTVNHLKDEFALEKVICFGHSMGGILLGDIVHTAEAIDAIAMYGSLTNIDCQSLHLVRIIEFLDSIRGSSLKKIDFGKLLWIFDKETRDYFNTVIVGNPEYNYQFLKFEYDFSYVRKLIELAYDFTNRILEWGKPALFMFGSNDRLTHFSKNHFPDSFTIKNLYVRHIENGHHITPCRYESNELLKLNPFIDFVKYHI
jgi:pimeloyl-ACP methyl ester carboxylesterase